MNRTALVMLIATGSGLGSLTFAQAPPAAAPAGPPPVEATAPAPAGVPAVAYSYRPEGRRDPFISLTGRVSDGSTPGSRAAGLPGQLINEVSLKGIIKDARGFYALVQGADARTYTIRLGDRLMDGTVKAITADSVVFSQDVNDPLSLQKQREIRKSLRPGEESRG